MHIVVIPIYKPELTSDEAASLRQCVKILGTHPIVLIAPEALPTEAYHRTAGRTLDVEYFAAEYFKSLADYNRLMKTHDFYQRFSTYDYMLIYQLDAWVFDDQLDYWCNKGYDYIGAPWFRNFGTHEEGKRIRQRCGNGGFSLRRISKFLELTNPSTPLIRQFGLFCYLWDRFLAPLFGMQRTIGWLTSRKNNDLLQEDVYFCMKLHRYTLHLHRPLGIQAAKFCIEQSPAYLTSLTGQLPFGCHAWRRYNFDNFWSKYIMASIGSPTLTTDAQEEGLPS